MKDLVGSFFVVTNHDEEALSESQCTYLDNTLKNKFLLPNLLTFHEKTNIKQSFHTMTNEQRRHVVEAFKSGVNKEKFDEVIHDVLQKYHQQTFILTEKIEKLFNNKHHNRFIQIFAGSGAPRITSDYNAIQVALSSVTVHHRMCSIDIMDEYVPLSSGCFEHVFHGINIINPFVTAIERAVGPSGLFPVQQHSNHHGSALYIGERSENSQSQPSPSEGPGVHGQFSYRNYINHCFWPFCLSLFNKLGSCASRFDWYVYKYMAILYSLANDCVVKFQYCQLLIATMNFECTNHVNVVDKVSSINNDMLADLKTIMDDPLIDGKWFEQAKNADAFLRCHGSSTPTTCCYQFLHEYDDLEIIQFFCLPLLGICYRIQLFWAHCFMVPYFAHLTLTHVYVLNEKVPYKLRSYQK